MDTETGSVDILFEKPRLDIRRSLRKTSRGKTVTYKSLVPGFHPTVVKVVKGDEVSKKKKTLMSKSVLDDFSPEVFYSLKKKKRWQELNSVDAVLSTVIEDSHSFTVSALERNPKGHLFSGTMHDKEVRIYGRIKADSDEIEKISARSGRGGALLSLEDSLECRKGKNKKSEEEKVKPREPEVTFIIDKQRNSQQLPGLSFVEREISYKGEKHTHRANKLWEKSIDEDLKETFHESDEEVIDEFGNKGIFDDVDRETFDGSDEEIEGKSKSFVLSDFIKSPSPKKEKVRQKKVRDVIFLDEIPSEIMEFKNKQKPLNEHEILKDSSFISKEIDLRFFFSRPESFFEKLEEWVKIYKDTINVIWLNEEKTKCLVDFSRKFYSKNLAAVIGFSILGKKKTFLRITFNTNFPFEYPEKELQKFSKPEKQSSPFFDRLLHCLEKASLPVFLKRKDFKSLEEAFQCESDPNVECFDDYELVEKFMRLTEPSSSESTSVPSLESLHFDSCEFCGQSNPSNMIDLSCIHSLCLSCARFAFKDQIVSHSKELICPICESTQDIMRLTFAVPIPLIKTFIKEKFRTLVDNEVRECPKCLGQFEKIPGAHSVSCKKCHIAFCQKCLQSSHFPLSCDQMRIWLPKFEEQYKLYCMKKLPRYGICSCGNYVELMTSAIYGYGYANCKECNAYYYMDSNGDWVYHFYEAVTYLKTVDASEIPIYIKKPFAECCAEIRNEIRDRSKIAKIRKPGKELLERKQVDQFINLRFNILKLIEYGTAWLYFERKNRISDKNKEVSKTLNELKLFLDSIVIQITNKNSLKIEENINSLQDSYSKALKMF